MADWVTISSLATAGGTLALAAATFGSVRSANRAARIAERSFAIGQRPVLVPSRPEDPTERIDFSDGRVLSVPGGKAAIEEADGTYFMAIPVRNVGAGLAVLHGWYVRAGRPSATEPHADAAEFRVTHRDLYVAPGDTSYWQGSIRDADDPWRAIVRDAFAERRPLSVEVLYGDTEGTQRTISRYAILPRGEDRWSAAIGRHWNLDGADPHTR
jgi:hypothetical protein